MELVWASEDFLLNGVPYSRFPIVLWDTMQSCVPINRFLRHHLLRGAVGSTQSWPSTARALYDYFSFLQAHALDWREVDRGEAVNLVAAYRDYCKNQCLLAPNTIRQRLHYVCKFYEFAHINKWIERLPFAWEERSARQNIGFLAHISTKGGKVMSRDVMPRKLKYSPKYLTWSDIKALLAAIENPHHRMLIRLGLHTGLRREEIATLPLSYIFDPEKKAGTERNFLVHIDPSDGSGMATKGNRARNIIISRKFMSELYHYASTIRGERASLAKETPTTFLLNHEGERYGTHGKSLNRIIKNLGDRAGIKINTHMLRHTYATHTLINLQRQSTNKIDPLVYVQRQLGHASIHSTMIYLHLIDEMADEAILAYDDELNSLAESV
ncbi:site-specific integrase [Pseudomonas putida]|uniref:tyrosine-type recombinase/integrase n=1 Tax=Pseudomonas putida TaxID=303 RepID=UPI002168E177|nr:site-specific integrase [Pseudomonas putida]MCS4065477.1 integrase [Pseudomonas putida]